MGTEDMKSKSDKKQLSSYFQYEQLIVCGTKYLIGARKINESRQIMLTDLTNFYEETLSKEDSIKRIEDLNPLLPDCDIDEILDDILLNIPKYATSCSLQCVELEHQIEDGCFWFQINLTKTDAQPFQDQHIEHFYISLSELFHRYHCLLDLVKKKDREIEEYKAQGVNILKRSLVTEPFNEQLFETKLRKTESKEKTDILLQTMRFFNTIVEPDSKEDMQKNDSSRTNSNITNTQVLDVPSINKKVAVKKPSSGDIRCAVIPKVGKMVKKSKPNAFL